MFDNKYPYTDYHELNLDWFMGEFKKLVAEWEETKGEWNTLHDYVQNYFENLNVQTEIDNKINAMIADGTFADIVSPFVTAALPALVAGQLPDVVAAQISSVVAAQISAVVAAQLPAVAAAAAAAEVGDWLIAHIDPDTGYVIDDTLTVSQAAADAKTVGDICSELNDNLDELHQSITESYVVNYANILPDWKMTGATALDASTEIIPSDDSPSNIIHIENTTGDVVGASLSIGTLFRPMVAGTYYFHIKAKVNRNSAYAYQIPGMAFRMYLDDTLKGSKTLVFDIPSAVDSENDYKEYTLPITFSAGDAAFNNFHLTTTNKFDYWIKDFYIIKGADNQYGYCKKLYNETDIVNIIEHNQTVNPSLKVAIIGDSLSAESESVTVKYHDLLAANNNYTIQNCSISGAGYCNGSLKNGTRDHYFYNQATNIAAGTEAVLVFGSFNDMSLFGGNFFIYDSSDNIISSGSGGAAPSSTATLLSTDASTVHTYTHNATADIAAGTYRMVCNGVTYQFTTTTTCPAGGKIVYKIISLGEIGTDDNDTDTIVGAFKAMLDNIYTINNGMIIGIVTPTPWILYNNISPISETALSRCKAYIDKLIELANYYMLPIMNLYDVSNLRPWDSTFRSSYYNNADGVHPNNDGHELYIYPHMREFLRTFNYKNIR